MIKVQEPTTTMQPHPAAELFPLMSGTDLDGLIADIRDHGQREPIIVHDGLILDGRNRYRACQQLGIEPLTTKWDRDGTPEAFVVSMNLHRRHLNEAQRGMIAARLANIRHGEVGGTHKRLETQIPISTAAKMLNVGKSTVDSARVVLHRGTVEEIAAADAGEVGIDTVARAIRKGAAPEKRKARRAAPLAQAGGNPERIQRQQMHAEIWARLSDGLIGLTSLPLPSDVVEIVAANLTRSRVVDDRLARSLQWLKDFDHAWRNRG